MQSRIDGEIDSFESLAYSMFDEDMAGRGAVGNRLYISSPTDTKPCAFIEKTGESRFQIVMEWNSEEKIRENLETALYEDIRHYFD
ncbi:hypothetical protein SAMN05444007_103379 [Cribrihabitans marinus]|uniref:Uncharacterized protein n=2 Tax=Cribrihabitans marinus TaxID=1227549 RepID=A0A1H6WEL7_9RHOB|nr:hypothetical protein SAMN05444007_103379 [Cribrihabitans marinus]